MGTAEYQSNWERIQAGVRETERLIGQKQYNLSMIKARQTLEYMIRCLGEKACIMESDMADSIDQLYESRWISKTTMEHYHKIRTIGNKAVHENDNSPYNANQAYHMLSQEVYTFSNDYSGGRRKPAASKSQNSRQQPAGKPAQKARTASSGAKSASRPSSKPASRSASYSSAGSKRKPRKNKFSPNDIIRFCIPVVCVIVLIIVISLLRPWEGGKKDTPTTTAPIETTTDAETTAPAAEEPAEPATEAVVYKTNATLNVRTEPNTTCSIVTQLPPGTAVNYVGPYDDSWTIINYDGQDVYVSTQYLTAQ